MANRKRWSAHRGIFTQKPQSVIDQQNLWDFERAVKEELNRVHVPFSDDCEDCPVEDSPTPVRYNTEDEVFEYWDEDEGEWTEITIDITDTPPTAANITQLVSGTTGVEANGQVGVITTVALTTAAGAYAEFTFTNSSILSTSVIQLTGLNSGTGQLAVALVSVSAGSAVIRYGNIDNSEAFNSLIKIHYRID